MYANSYTVVISSLLSSAAVTLTSASQPCQGPLVFTCTASQVSPQMRVTVQSPTVEHPVERTVSYLHHSDSYDVSLAPLPNNAVMLTVTIRNVAEHMGTRYRCVQHRDEGTIASEELVIMSELSWDRLHG